MRPQLLFAVVMIASGCEQPPSQPAAASAPATAVASAPSAPSAYAMPSSIASVVAPRKTLPPITLPPGRGSQGPTLKDWKGAAEVAVTHAPSLGCKAQLLREWLRVVCSGAARSGVGEPNAVRVIRSTGAEGRIFATPTGFFASLQPGIDIAVAFHFPFLGAYEFRASYPQGGSVTAGFDRAGPADDTLYPPLEEEGVERMLLVAAGKAKDGSAVGPLYVDRTEVTVRAYRLCVEAGSCEAAKDKGCVNGNLHDEPLLPQNCVTLAQAEAYCKWAGKRLPSEQEWSQAALGPDGRELPWGNERYSTHMVMIGREWVSNATWYTMGERVMTHPLGISPFGLHDAAGNVAEWTSTRDADKAVAMGGHFKRREQSWDDFFKDWRMALAPDTRRADLGMRCAKDQSN